jgi:hypothetical protein
MFEADARCGDRRDLDEHEEDGEKGHQRDDELREDGASLIVHQVVLALPHRRAHGRGFRISLRAVRYWLSIATPPAVMPPMTGTAKNVRSSAYSTSTAPRDDLWILERPVICVYSAFFAASANRRR